MSSIITGLFQNQNQAKAISSDLENADFRDKDFILYLHDKRITKEIKTSIWQSIFKEKRELEDESLVISVRVLDEAQIEKVKDIFTKNNVIHYNFFENIRFKDAKSLQYIKRILSIRAKSMIFNPPEINWRNQSEGINAEVTFGKS